jgi:hypothetical protein
MLAKVFLEIINMHDSKLINLRAQSKAMLLDEADFTTALTNKEVGK